MKWSVVYRKCYNPDGSLYFHKLNEEFLQNARRTLGSYRFANQYLNEVIPADEISFKPEWIKYYKEIPKRVNTFAFIDPAISQNAGADFTGIVVVRVDSDNRWYVEYAARKKLNPTEIVSLMFVLHDRYKPNIIGVEDVAFQKALLHFAHEEMRRRNKIIPIQGVNPGTDKSKEMRILGLVPRFEWGSIYLNTGLSDLEDELARFPRSAHDDISDALSSVSYIAYAPPKEKHKDEPPNPNDAREYEDWYRRQLVSGKDPKRARPFEEGYDD